MESISTSPRSVRDSWAVARIHGAVDEHQRSSAAIAEAMQLAQKLGLGVKHSTRDQTREARRIAEVAAAIQELTRKVRDTTDIQHKAAEETLATLGVFRGTAEEAAEEARTLHGLVEMLSTRSTALAKQIDRFEITGDEDEDQSRG